MTQTPARVAFSAALLLLPLGCNGGSEPAPAATDTSGDLACKSMHVQAANTCGCDLSIPVDPATLIGGEKLWPFGVHGSFGHKEGHRGFDFISTSTAPITAPAAGVITRLERTTQLDGEYVAAAKVLYLKLDCGIQVSFQPVIADAALVVGARVTQGQALGTLPELIPPYGPGRFSTHFDTVVGATPGSDEYNQCPAYFFPAGHQATLQAMVDATAYVEKIARNPPGYTCTDGSTPGYAIPAENQLCNPRASATLKAAITSCITPTLPVW